MERERRSRSTSPTPQHQPVPPPSALTSPQTMKKVYGTHGVSEARNSTPRTRDDGTQGLLDEVKSVRQALHVSRLELREAESTLKDTREKAEDARTQLMLTEFKRTTAMKDLERVMEDVERKKNEANNMDAKVKVRNTQEVKALRDQLESVQAECARQRERLRSAEGLSLERDELVRQLEQTKDELFQEQKHARLQKEELQEEIETLMFREEESQGTHGEMQGRMVALEDRCRTLEREKEVIVQDKSHECEELQQRLQGERAKLSGQYELEKSSLQSEVLELRHKLGQLQDELNKTDDTDLKLRDQLLELQQELCKERDARDAIADDHKRVLTTLRKETDCAMMKLRESLFLEKQQALEMVRGEMEEEKRAVSESADKRISMLMAEHSSLINEKGDEICRLQELVRSLEEERQLTEHRVQEDITNQVREAVSRERQVLETEKELWMRREKEAVAGEAKQRVCELSVEVARERQLKEDLMHQLHVIRQELDTQRQQSRQLTKEKVFAVARAKDLVRDQANSELERIREKVKQDQRAEVEGLRGQVKSLEEEVRQLKKERQVNTRHERDTNVALERAERTVVNEVNEECRRSAGLLGITPRKVIHDSACNSPVPFTSSGKYRTPITVALANLRACNEELRSHIGDLRQELESHKTLLLKTQRDKEESVDQMRREMEKEKSVEVNNLKDRLMREGKRGGVRGRLEDEDLQHQRHLHLWNQDMTDKYVIKIEEELNKQLEIQQQQSWAIQHELQQQNSRQQREIDRLQKELLTTPQSPSLNFTSPSRTFPGKVSGTLNSLQRPGYTSMAASVPDLSNPAHFRHTSMQPRSVSPTREQLAGRSAEKRSMENRFRTAEKDAALAEQHTKQNQAALSQKMTEMNKLQNALTNQTKELMDLERAYSHLHRQYNQRPSSPTRVFTATRN